MNSRPPIEIAVAHGDGIGPEIMKATLTCLNAIGAPLAIREIEVGEKIYLQGEPTGISQKSWEALKTTKAFLKAPITTPQGGGFRSLNVTIRTALGLYANVRPCVSYAPFIRTLHPNMDVVIVRENEEDLYTGIEYNLSDDTKIALKIITEPGCRKIIRYAFDYALHHGRKKVTCFTKDNIMKLSDGLFHRIFDEIKTEYPTIEAEHWIVDIGAAKLADKPDQFDVVVLPNLYGDILSDVAAQIAGSVGLAGSANIGTNGAMFEAIHGSAPRRAGQDIANPSGLMLASVMMLNHLGLNDEAELLHNAWLTTLEEGINTYDIYQEGMSTKKVGTQEFAKEVISRIGKKPHTLQPVSYHTSHSHVPTPLHSSTGKTHVKHEVGCQGADFYLQLSETTFNEIVAQIQKCENLIQKSPFILHNVFSRGANIWPQKLLDKPISGSIIRLEVRRKNDQSMSHHLVKKALNELHSQFLQHDIDIRAFVVI